MTQISVRIFSRQKDFSLVWIPILKYYIIVLYITYVFGLTCLGICNQNFITVFNRKYCSYQYLYYIWTYIQFILGFFLNPWNWSYLFKPYLSVLTLLVLLYGAFCSKWGNLEKPFRFCIFLVSNQGSEGQMKIDFMSF